MDFEANIRSVFPLFNLTYAAKPPAKLLNIDTHFQPFLRPVTGIQRMDRHRPLILQIKFQSPFLSLIKCHGHHLVMARHVRHSSPSGNVRLTLS